MRPPEVPPLAVHACSVLTGTLWMLPLFASGRLAAVVDAVYPLEEVAEAHRLMESNANFGKIVLRVGESGRP